MIVRVAEETKMIVGGGEDGVVHFTSFFPSHFSLFVFPSSPSLSLCYSEGHVVFLYVAVLLW